MVKANQQQKGPRTPEGKKRSSLNATKHGIRAASLVIPGETEAEWRAYHDAIVGAYAPVGAQEQDLAGRIAATQWRLSRLDRIEASLLADHAQANAARTQLDDAERRRLDALTVRLTSTLDLLTLFEEIHAGRPETTLTPDQVRSFIAELCHADPDFIPDELHKDGSWQSGALEGWTVSHAQALANDLAEVIGVDAPITKTLRSLEDKASGLRTRLDEISARLDLLSGTRRMLVPPKQADQLLRERAHLFRSWQSLVHEYEALQRHRVGLAAPLVRIEAAGSLPAADDALHVGAPN
jgi:hypothetical protein